MCMRAPPVSSSVTFLERHLLADRLLGDPRRGQVHRGVTVDHADPVAKGRHVGAAGRRGTEQAADLGNAAGETDLEVEDAGGPTRAGVEAELFGEPAAGRVDEVEAGSRSRPARSRARICFSTESLPQEPALTVGSWATTSTWRPSTVPLPVSTASAGSPSREAASRPSSTKEPGSSKSSSRSRTGSFVPSRERSPPSRARSLSAASEGEAPLSTWLSIFSKSPNLRLAGRTLRVS